MIRTQLKEVVECLKALRPKMHNAAEASAIDELDWAIEKLDGLITKAEQGGDPHQLSQQALHYIGICLRQVPQIARVIEWFSQ